MKLFSNQLKAENKFDTKIFINCCLILFSSYLPAAELNEVNKAAINPDYEIQLIREPNISDFLDLKAKQASLGQVLNEIDNKTGTRLHYSSLPVERVTLHCKGSLKAVLFCVMGVNIDIVFRYKKDKMISQPESLVAEAWILPVTAVAKLMPIKPEESVPVDAAIDNTDKLLQDANNPQLKMEAIARLAVEGRKDDLLVYNTLKQALSDKNPGVRAQAIFGLVKREGEHADDFIQQAMADKNVDVRLMALESLGNNPKILQQALNDSDINVRQMAIAKLTAQNNFN